MSMVEYSGTPEYFVSRVQHIEDMQNGNMRVWYCVDRRGPDGITETEMVLTVIMPVAAIPDAVAKRHAVFGRISDSMVVLPRQMMSALLH